MTGVEEVDTAQLPLECAGQVLRRAREEKGLSLKDIADKTRISTHHLEAIEAGSFSRLPGRTYALGFSPPYARAMGLGENSFVDREGTRLHSTHQSAPQKPHSS